MLDTMTRGVEKQLYLEAEFVTYIVLQELFAS